MEGLCSVLCLRQHATAHLVSNGPVYLFAECLYDIFDHLHGLRFDAVGPPCVESVFGSPYGDNSRIQFAWNDFISLVQGFWLKCQAGR